MSKDKKDAFKEAVKAVNKEDKDNKSKKKKKVMRIAIGQFLFASDGRSVATCKHIKDALDISDWTFEQVSHVISNLNKVGYKPEVVEVKNDEKKL